MAVEDRWYRKDKTPKPEHGQGKRWRVVWYEDGARRRQSFDTKDQAKAFQTRVDHDQRSGTYVARDKKQTRVADLLPDWEASMLRLKPSTRQEVRYTIRGNLEPYWGRRAVGEITRRDVQDWVHALHDEGKAARTVDTIYGRFRAFMNWAALEGYIPSSPCQKIQLPRGYSREHIILTPDEVRDLLEEIPEHYRLLVETLVVTGLRFGEVAELRTKDVDLRRRRILVSRAVVRGVVGSPKSHKRREVPLTPSLAERLAERLEGAKRGDLIFTTPRGAQLRANNFKRAVFDPAVERAHLPEGLRVHDLRHTSASLLVRSGASVKALQSMLGHADAKITLGVYSGLFGDELDDLGGRMGDLFDTGS